MEGTGDHFSMAAGKLETVEKKGERYNNEHSPENHFTLSR
jgi:hypothetical protein